MLKVSKRPPIVLNYGLGFSGSGWSATAPYIFDDEDFVEEKVALLAQWKLGQNAALLGVI
jgi:hypothetical protein